MDNSIQAHQKELCNKLWAMANALRGNMEAYEFKKGYRTACAIWFNYKNVRKLS